MPAKRMELVNGAWNGAGALIVLLYQLSMFDA